MLVYQRLPQHLMLDYHVPIRIAVEVRAYPMFQNLQVACFLIISWCVPLLKLGLVALKTSKAAYV